MSEEVKSPQGSGTSSPVQNSSSRPSSNYEGGGSNFKKKFVFRKKECYFTKNKITQIDYKDVDLLKRFVGKNGRILPRRFTGTTALFQRKLGRAIKKARAIALLPYVGEIEYARKKMDRGDRPNDRYDHRSRQDAPAASSATPTPTPEAATPAPAAPATPSEN